MDGITGHWYALLFGLVILAALIAVIYIGVKRFHRHLHRHM